MKTLVSALVSVAISAGAAQLYSGNASSHGVGLYFETRIEPQSPPIRKHGGGILTENDVIKRHICNFDNRTYFGYDLSAEPLGAGSGRYRLRFSTLTLTPEVLGRIFKVDGPWTLLTLPGGAVSMDVAAGETVALDLFANSSTGQKVTEYLTVGWGNGSSKVRKPEGPPQDFSPEDSVIELRSPQVTMDGKPLASSKAGVSGHAVWIDLPGQGRFVLSLVPRHDLGMQKAGEVRGSELWWTLDGHTYDIANDRAVTSGSRAYNLYVFHVPRTVDSLQMSAGPSPEGPIRKR